MTRNTTDRKGGCRGRKAPRVHARGKNSKSKETSSEDEAEERETIQRLNKGDEKYGRESG